jgi:hypothetical protein
MGDECVERGYCQQLFWYLEEKTKSEVRSVSFLFCYKCILDSLLEAKICSPVCGLEDSLDIVHELNMIGKSSPMYMVRYYILIKVNQVRCTIRSVFCIFEIQFWCASECTS